MTTLHRVKAYFGMVPADELDSYDGYDDRYEARDRHPADRHSSDRYRYDRYDDRYESRYEGRQDRYEAARDSRDTRDADERRGRYGSDERTDDRGDRHDRYDDPRDRRTPRPRDPEVTEIRRDDEPATETVPRAGRGRSWAANTGPSHTSVRPTTPRTPPSLSSTASSGSGAGGSTGSSAPSVSSLPTAAPAAPATAPKAAPEPDPVSAPAEITSLQPKSYNEARLIGERYRDGIPVIMNLTEMDDVGAKRLVDFAAGLAFALRGSIEKVTNRVFLLSPPNVEVSADDRRKLAEKNFAQTS
ncbi:cell division protein SepF [Actinomycetospora sp. CA-101289]|uniref:cell division protein SepF n=1 Tax=Actinomycetospora sp. CA-101289 TaxID=3239893 RepID=UPI003D9543DC